MNRSDVFGKTAFFLIFCWLGSYIWAADWSAAETESGSLRSFRDEESIFQVQYQDGFMVSQVTASEDGLTLKLMDEIGRVTRKVSWNSSFSVIEKEVLLEYEGESVLVFREVRRYPLLERSEILEYTSRGELDSVKEYNAETLVREKKWQYDADGRCITESVTDYTAGSTKESRYQWKPGIRQPDEKLYEQGVLIKEIVWLNDSDYAETLYFDTHFQVYSEYSDGLQKVERVLSNGKEIRSTTW